MRFLSNTDYRFKITDYDLATLLEDDISNELLEDSESKAIEEIQLYLRKRYDLTQLFVYYPVYVSGLTYTTGSTVWYNPSTGNTNYLYTPTGSTASLPSTVNWQRNDTRYPLIVDWVTTIALYKLHSRVSPMNVPKQREDQYVQVLSMMKMIRDGKVSVDFPEIQDRERNIYITGATSQGSYLW